MKIAIVGDHSEYHCGSAAVMRVITSKLSLAGEIVQVTDDFDALVVNGEGSMHHGSGVFHNKMREIVSAQRRNKRTYLVNTVWEKNPDLYNANIARLDDLVFRGAASQSDMHRRHGLAGRVCLDLSYFDVIDESAPFQDLQGAVAITDVFAAGFKFVWLEDYAHQEWVQIDLQKMSWSSLVKTLRTASVLVAGRHHALYAACKARTPFVPVQGNSHKFEDLLLSARSSIPICREGREIAAVLKWAQQNSGAYAKLFDWMEQQPVWEGLPGKPRRPGSTIKPPFEYPPRVLAKIAEARGAFLEASNHWSDAARLEPDNLDFALNSATMAIRGDDVARGALELVAMRWRHPAYGAAVHHLMRTQSRDRPWQHPGETVVGWWEKLRRVASSLAEYDVEAEQTAMEDTIACAIDEHGPMGGATARFLLARRLLRNNRQGLAPLAVRLGDFSGVPSWILDHDIALIDIGRRSFSEDTNARIARIMDSPAWAAADTRADVVELLLLRDGADENLVKSAINWLDVSSRSGRLPTIAASIAAQCGDESAALSLLASEPACLKAADEGNLVLSDCAARAGLKATRLDMNANVYSALMDGLQRLQDVLADPSKKIAVVGNSPCEIGRGAGADIDRHDLVVRFNRFDVGLNFQSDYGSKADLIVSVDTGEIE